MSGGRAFQVREQVQRSWGRYVHAELRGQEEAHGACRQKEYRGNESSERVKGGKTMMKRFCFFFFLSES